MDGRRNRKHGQVERGRSGEPPRRRQRPRRHQDGGAEEPEPELLAEYDGEHDDVAVADEELKRFHAVLDAQSPLRGCAVARTPPVLPLAV